MLKAQNPARTDYQPDADRNQSRHNDIPPRQQPWHKRTSVLAQRRQAGSGRSVPGLRRHACTSIPAPFAESVASAIVSLSAALFRSLGPLDPAPIRKSQEGRRSLLSSTESAIRVTPPRSSNSSATGRRAAADESVAKRGEYKESFFGLSAGNWGHKGFPKKPQSLPKGRTADAAGGTNTSPLPGDPAGASPDKQHGQAALAQFRSRCSLVRWYYPLTGVACSRAIQADFFSGRGVRARLGKEAVRPALTSLDCASGLRPSGAAACPSPHALGA